MRKRIKCIPVREITSLHSRQRELWDVPTFPVWRMRQEIFLQAVMTVTEPGDVAYEEAKTELFKLLATYPKYYTSGEILEPCNPDSLVNPTRFELARRTMKITRLVKQMNMPSAYAQVN